MEWEMHSIWTSSCLSRCPGWFVYWVSNTSCRCFFTCSAPLHGLNVTTYWHVLTVCTGNPTFSHQTWWNPFWQDQLVLWQIRIVKHNDTALLLTRLRLLKPKLCLHTVSTTAICILGFCAKRLFWQPSETRSKSHLSVMLPDAKYHKQYCFSTNYSIVCVALILLHVAYVEFTANVWLS